jgi:hypothetical protein
MHSQHSVLNQSEELHLKWLMKLEDNSEKMKELKQDMFYQIINNVLEFQPMLLYMK